MVKCDCGKEMAAVPNWLSDVKATFVCNNCPSRDVQNITQVDLGSALVDKEEAAAEEKKAEEAKKEEKK